MWGTWFPTARQGEAWNFLRPPEPGVSGRPHMATRGTPGGPLTTPCLGGCSMRPYPLGRRGVGVRHSGFHSLGTRATAPTSSPLPPHPAWSCTGLLNVFFSCGKIHTTQNLPLHFLLCDSKCIHSVVQPSPPLFPRAFYLSRLALCPHDTPTPCPTSTSRPRSLRSAWVVETGGADFCLCFPCRCRRVYRELQPCRACPLCFRPLQACSCCCSLPPPGCPCPPTEQQ